MIPRLRQQNRPAPPLPPHLEFVDMGGHGDATARLTGDEMRAGFIGIPGPITRSGRPDSVPLRYRAVHTASLWKQGAGLTRLALPRDHQRRDGRGSGGHSFDVGQTAPA